jgi:hypothetical protein
MNGRSAREKEPNHACCSRACSLCAGQQHALNYCMLLPGPEAKQLAVYIGWLMHRTLGGIMAGAQGGGAHLSPSWVNSASNMSKRSSPSCGR